MYFELYRLSYGYTIRQYTDNIKAGFLIFNIYILVFYKLYDIKMNKTASVIKALSYINLEMTIIF